MSDNTYRGWSNYPTWCVNLWISNDEYLHAETLEKARHWVKTSDSPAWSLATDLKDWVRNDLAPKPELEGFASDLLHYALDQVDWHEIASAWLEDASDA